MISYPFQKVLLPYDFSPHAEKVLTEALDAADDPATLTVLHVGAPKSGYVPADPAIAWAAVSDDERRAALESEFLSRSDDPRRRQANFDVRFGAPGEQIAHYADDHNYDLILMPSHGRTGLSRLLIGSVAENVVRHAHCNVMIIRD